MSIVIMREGAEYPPKQHTFYWGMHPVSWFILIVNVSLGVFEWSYIIYQKCFAPPMVEEEEETGVREETEDDDDDADE